MAVGVCGLGIWKRQPSDGVGGNRGPTSTDVGVFGPETLECGRSVDCPANPLSIVAGSTLKQNKMYLVTYMQILSNIILI